VQDEIFSFLDGIGGDFDADCGGCARRSGGDNQEIHVWAPIDPAL
jgi:hypothetical protein